MDHLLQLNSVGLAFDGLGVAILGFAFFAKSLPALIVESGTYWGGTRRAPRAGARSLRTLDRTVRVARRYLAGLLFVYTYIQ